MLKLRHLLHRFTKGIKLKFGKFDEVEYLTDITKLRYGVAGILKKHGIVDEIIVNNDVDYLDQSCGRLTKNSALTIDFLDGSPRAIGSIYGEIKPDAAEHRRGSLRLNQACVDEICNTYGLVQIMPVVKDFGIEVGPKYVVTRYPWKADQKIKAKYHEEKTPLTHQQMMANFEKLDELQKRVNLNLIRNNQAHLTVEVPERIPITDLEIL